MQRSLGVAAVALTVVAVAACSSPSTPAPPAVSSGTSAPSSVPPAAAGTVVTIDDFAFVPATLTVKRGDTVTWTNHDEEPHTVAANDGSFRSPGMGANGTYNFTFGTPGTFDYICSIHPFMHGTVVVTP